MSQEPINVYECPAVPALAYKIAVMQAALKGAPVQCQLKAFITSEPWNSLQMNQATWSWDACRYRINPASRPPPKMKRVALEPSDFGPVTWIGEGKLRHLVVAVSEIGISTTAWLGSYVPFARLMQWDYQRSIDCLTWTPCYKEVEDTSDAS